MKPRILVAGNSQASCVKQAYDLFPALLKDHVDAYFYVIPGGVGPDFTIEDDKLVVGKFNPTYPPYASPAETPSIPLSRFDAIVVSALGNCDGGFLYQSPVLMRGVLHAFGPKPNEVTSRPISKSCFRSMLRGEFEQHPGFGFLKRLRAAYAGPIFVQPTPYLSSIVAQRQEWILNVLYDRPLDANRFIQSARIDVFDHLCSEIGVLGLTIPNSEWSGDAFTPDSLVKPADGIHPTPEYGGIVLGQIAAALRRSRA